MNLTFIGFAVLATTIALPAATAHDMVVPVLTYYVVVNQEDGYVEVWRETNGLSGLQKVESCIDEGKFVICFDPDTLIARVPP